MTDYNLVREPWIEYTDRDKQPRHGSLSDLFEHADDVVSIDGDAPVTASVLRLLVAILRDALGTGPLTQEQWDGWFHDGLPADLVADYLAIHEPRFNLYGPRPFFQYEDLAATEATGGGWKSMAELHPAMPSGANAVIYDHHTGLNGPNPPAMSPGTAANWLISTHSYTRPGMFPGIDRPRESGRGGNLLSRLALIPTGSNLRETLLLSLPLGARNTTDQPPWRRQAPIIPAPVPGVVSLLTWQTRAALLAHPDGDGLIRRVKLAAPPIDTCDTLVPRAEQAALDPHLMFIPVDKTPQNPDGFAILGYTPGRALWRDSSMIAAYTGDASALRRARTITDRPVRIQTYSLAVQSTAKYVDWFARSVQLPADPAALPYAAEAAAYTDAMAAALGKAIYTFLGALGVLSPSASTTQKLAIRDSGQETYWTQLGRHAQRFPDLLDHAADDTARAALVEGWREHARHAAVAALKRLRDDYAHETKAPAAYGFAFRVMAMAINPPPPKEKATKTAKPKATKPRAKKTTAPTERPPRVAKSFEPIPPTHVQEALPL